MDMSFRVLQSAGIRYVGLKKEDLCGDYFSSSAKMTQAIRLTIQASEDSFLTDNIIQYTKLFKGTYPLSIYF